jgi:hypothetical protein
MIVGTYIAGAIKRRRNILSLYYYKESWFDFTSLLAELASDDSQRLCLQWLQDDIEFTDIQEGSSEYAQKIYYIFSNKQNGKVLW